MSIPVAPIPDGTRFGRGVVLGTGIRCGGAMRPGAILRCDCGQHYAAVLAALRSGKVNSCGCLKREHARQMGRQRTTHGMSRQRATHGMSRQRATHGMRRHPLYDTWYSMLQRCGNSEHHDYPYYGGRGIRICPRWHDVAAFIEDIEAILGPRPEGHTLDRIRNGLGYKPSNVRWATRAQQLGNRRPYRQREVTT